MAAYLDHKFQEECEAVQREMAGVEIPLRLEKKLRKMAADKEKEAFFGKPEAYARCVSGMRALSRLCRRCGNSPLHRSPNISEVSYTHF